MKCRLFLSVAEPWTRGARRKEPVPGATRCVKRPEQEAGRGRGQVSVCQGRGGDGESEGAPGKWGGGLFFLTSPSRLISAAVCVRAHRRSRELWSAVRSVHPNVAVPSVFSPLCPCLRGISFQGDKKCPTLGRCDVCTALNTLNHCALSVGEHRDV